jgi:hypothetical protein
MFVRKIISHLWYKSILYIYIIIDKIINNFYWHNDDIIAIDNIINDIFAIDNIINDIIAIDNITLFISSSFAI